MYKQPISTLTAISAGTIFKSRSIQTLYCTNIILYKHYTVQHYTVQTLYCTTLYCTNILLYNIILYKHYTVQTLYCTNIILHKHFTVQTLYCTNIILYKHYTVYNIDQHFLKLAITLTLMCTVFQHSLRLYWRHVMWLRLPQQPLTETSLHDELGVQIEGQGPNFGRYLAWNAQPRLISTAWLTSNFHGQYLRKFVNKSYIIERTA